MSNAYRATGKRISSQTHARRYWDCPCGRRVWGNGGKASHRWACDAAITQQIVVHDSLARELKTADRAAWHAVEADRWRARLHERAAAGQPT